MRELIPALVLLVTATAALAIDGSGTAKTEARTLGAFTKLKCGGTFELVVTCGKDRRCQITADDNLLPVITTTVSGDTLEIGTSDSISTKSGLKVELDVPDLVSIELSGTCPLKLDGVKNAALAISCSGTANVVATGETKDLKLDLSGAGKIDADALKSANAAVTCSGAGSIDVHATESLDAHVSGVGAVTYSGSPKTVNKQVSGVGSISPK